MFSNIAYCKHWQNQGGLVLICDVPASYTQMRTVLYPTPGAVIPITGGAGLISTLLQSCLPRITALPVIAPAILLFHNIICFVFCFCILGFLPEHRCRRFAEMFYHFCSRQIEASLALIISRHSSSIVGSDAAVMENFQSIARVPSCISYLKLVALNS